MLRQIRDSSDMKVDRVSRIILDNKKREEFIENLERVLSGIDLDVKYSFIEPDPEVYKIIGAEPEFDD